MTQTLAQYVKNNTDEKIIISSPSSIKISKVPCGVKLELNNQTVDITFSNIQDWKLEIPEELVKKIPDSYKPEQTSPELIKLSFKKALVDGWRVKICGEDYSICNHVSRNLWANSKRGTYGRGLANTSEDPYKVERTGLLGEMAFAKCFGLEVDTCYRENGIGHDFILNEKLIDVKTETKRHKYECGLIYARSDSGKSVPLKADIYVFGYVESEDVVNSNATVVLMGYYSKSDVERLLPQPGRRQGSLHMNYEVPYYKLKSLHEISNTPPKAVADNDNDNPVIDI